MNEKECEALLILRDLILMVYDNVKECTGAEPEHLHYLRRCVERLSADAFSSI